MRKKKKYLPLYYKWMKTGELPENGLCNVFDSKKYPFFDFSEHPLFKLFNSGRRLGCRGHGFWGADEGETDYNLITRKFTTLRQNIVLLMAALNGEL